MAAAVRDLKPRLSDQTGSRPADMVHSPAKLTVSFSCLNLILINAIAA